MSQKQSSGNKFLTTFVSGPLQLEISSGRKSRVETTIKLTEAQAAKFLEHAPLLENELLRSSSDVLIRQNTKFPLHQVKCERFNLESPQKGGYFGRIVLTCNLEFQSIVNLRQTRKRIRQHVEDVTSCPFRRVDPKPKEAGKRINLLQHNDSIW